MSCTAISWAALIFGLGLGAALSALIVITTLEK